MALTFIPHGDTIHTRGVAIRTHGDAMGYNLLPLRGGGDIRSHYFVCIRRPERAKCFQPKAERSGTLGNRG